MINLSMDLPWSILVLKQFNKDILILQLTQCKKDNKYDEWHSKSEIISVVDENQKADT